MRKYPVGLESSRIGASSEVSSFLMHSYVLKLGAWYGQGKQYTKHLAVHEPSALFFERNAIP